MPDITTSWNVAAQSGDWSQAASGASPGLVTGLDVETAVLLSLFTDAQAAPDDVIPDGSADPRGWWGDMGTDKPMGSKLWLLGRAKQTPDVLIKAKQYCVDALQWLLDDAVVSALTVNVSFVRNGMLGIVVVIDQGGGKPISLQYSWAWQGLQ